jgi:hypothetical protein
MKFFLVFLSRDIIADVNILQGTVFHEDNAQDLADAIDSEQKSDQNGEENIGVSCREKPKQLLKSKPAAHRVCISCNYSSKMFSLFIKSDSAWS